jgi:class 3 adenylate cyclase
MSVTETLSLLAVAALLFHLLGFYMLRRFSDQLLEVTNHIHHAASFKQEEILEQKNDYSVVELSTLTLHFQMLLNELDAQKKKQSTLIVDLMKTSRKEIERYQKKLAESEALQPYVNRNVIEQIEKFGVKGILSNQKRLVTVLFADIRGFTSLSESLEPDEMIPMLNEYFDIMVDVIHEHHGVVDKFIGDALMAVFGLTQPKERSTLDGVRAAIGMRDAIRQWTKKRRMLGLPTFSIGIGLNTGEVIAGNIGSKERKDYTIIGDTVNVASRLESIAKANRIIASESTQRRCVADVPMQKIGSMKLKNRSEPVVCYEVPEKEVIQKLLEKRVLQASGEFSAYEASDASDERSQWQVSDSD